MATDSQHPTRELLLLEASRQFAEHGFSGVSLDSIARAVGIRRPSLLHHFSSKTSLYREVFDVAMADWLARVEVAIAEAARDDWDKLDQVVSAAFDFFKANPNFVRILRREALDGTTHLGVDIGAALRPTYRKAVGFLERGMAAGSFHPQNAEQLVITAYAAIFSTFSDVQFFVGLLGRNPLSKDALDEREAHLRAFFRSALSPRPFELEEANGDAPAMDHVHNTETARQHRRTVLARQVEFMRDAIAEAIAAGMSFKDIGASLGLPVDTVEQIYAGA